MPAARKAAVEERGRLWTGQSVTFFMKMIPIPFHVLYLLVMNFMNASKLIQRPPPYY